MRQYVSSSQNLDDEFMSGIIWRHLSNQLCSSFRTFALTSETEPTYIEHPMPTLIFAVFSRRGYGGRASHYIPPELAWEDLQHQ